MTNTETEARATRAIGKQALTDQNLYQSVLHEIREAEKQRGAEVLAACQSKVSAYLKRVRENAKKESDANDVTGLPTNTTQGALTVLEGLQDLFSEIQPAAKDLEALLREEREKFRELSNAISQHTASHDLMCGCSECEPFYEAAKKARATLGAQK